MPASTCSSRFGVVWYECLTLELYIVEVEKLLCFFIKTACTCISVHVHIIMMFTDYLFCAVNSVVEVMCRKGKMVCIYMYMYMYTYYSL